MNLSEFQKATNSPTAVTLPSGVGLDCPTYNIMPTGAASGFVSAGSESILGPYGISTTGFISAGTGKFFVSNDGSGLAANNAINWDAAGNLSLESLTATSISAGFGGFACDGSGNLSIGSGAIEININGTLGVANGAFTISTDGGLNIGSGNFSVAADGSFSAANGAFTVAADGALNIGSGVAQINLDGSFVLGGFTGDSSGNLFVASEIDTPILNIAGTAALTGILTAVATLNFPSSLALAVSDLTITLTGAEVGDSVFLGVDAASVPTGGIFFAWVSAADTVTVRYLPAVMGNPASGDFRVTILKF